MYNGNGGFLGYPQQQPQMNMNYFGVQPQQVPKKVNALTDEEIDRLQVRPQFSLEISEEDKLRASCRHIGKDGNYSLQPDPKDPNYTVCSICGHRFLPIRMNAPEEEIQAITEEFVNLLQTIKVSFIDFPNDAVRNYFGNLIPLVEKAPKLFNLAMNNFAKYENNANPYGYQQQNQNALGMLNNFLSMTGGGMNMGFQPQTGYNPMPGYVPQSNGFGFPGAQPMGGYQPMTNNFSYNPAPAPTPAASPLESTPAPASTTTTVNVEA